ncbi:MAG: diguanylate cyclase, partial [Rhodospirillaceae bacterium]|nr:diguanylate cyclase [Rhodospirillaceae bacterium]
SIGIAIYPQHGEENLQLLKNADTAMYSAKKSGRNGFRFFEESMARD